MLALLISAVELFAENQFMQCHVILVRLRHLQLTNLPGLATVYSSRLRRAKLLSV